MSTHSGEHKLDSNITDRPVTVGVSHQTLPEFGSVNDTCRIFGLGRTKLFSYIKNGSIRSVRLREEGRISGRRLIYLPSVREFLFKQMDQPGTEIDG